MEGSALTPFALGFMLFSMGAVTTLAIYCYWRILTEPRAGRGTPSTAPPSEDRPGGSGLSER